MQKQYIETLINQRDKIEFMAIFNVRQRNFEMQKCLPSFPYCPLCPSIRRRLAQHARNIRKYGACFDTARDCFMDALHRVIDSKVRLLAFMQQQHLAIETNAEVSLSFWYYL